VADSTADLTVEILRQIRDQLAKTDGRVETLSSQQAESNELTKVLVGSHSKLNDKVETLNQKVENLSQKVENLNEKVEATNVRLDRLTGEIVKSRTHDAARLLDLDERMARIEKHLGLQGH
jgi:predicted  nucleic acid-binding Zn-ribbon protein